MASARLSLLPLLPLLLLLVQRLPPCAAVSEGARIITSVSGRKEISGALCTQRFLIRKIEKTSKSVAMAHESCSDFSRNSVHQFQNPSISGGRAWRVLQMRDVTSFFDTLRRTYNNKMAARTLTVFAVAFLNGNGTDAMLADSAAANAGGGVLCYKIKLLAREVGNTQPTRYRYAGIDVDYRTEQTGVGCPVTEEDLMVSHVVCVMDNCTLPPPPKAGGALGPLDDNNAPVTGPVINDPDAERLCDEDAVPGPTYARHRLWVIIAGVVFNLLLMVLLGALIHVCIKYRRLRRRCRLVIGSVGGIGGADSIAGTASPPTAIRHIGSTPGGGHLLHMAPYPDIQYSSIARRKYKAAQRGIHGGPLDDETMSYRSDHTRLLIPAPPTMNTNGGAAVSPPRGFTDGPSTPGSVRRHGSVSGASISSANVTAPRRNGSIPAPPLRHSPPEPQATIIY